MRGRLFAVPRVCLQQRRLALASPSPIATGPNGKTRSLISEKRVAGLEKVRELGFKIAARLGIGSDSLHRWYEVTPADVIRHGGMELHWHYRYSIPMLAIRTYPDHPWEASKFRAESSLSKLSDSGYARAALLYLGEQLGIDVNNLENWYKISSKSMNETGVLASLPPRLNTRMRLLRSAYPDYPWDPEKFEIKDKDYWKSVDNRRRAIEQLGEKLGIKKGDYEAWYNVVGLPKLLPRESTKQTRCQVLSSVFPEHKWSRHLFVSSRVDIFSASDSALTGLAKDLELLLGIEDMDQWYSITRRDLIRLGFRSSFITTAHLLHMLQVTYPSISWEPSRFKFTASGLGSLLANLVKLFGPKATAERDSLPPTTPFKKAMLIPKYKLLFDYQGPQYYAKPLLEKAELIERQERPALAKWCQENGATLISVPFWFDRDKKFLLVELWSLRPDLFESLGPLSSYQALASSTPREPTSILRRRLKLHRKNLRVWGEDPRYANLKVAENSLPKKRGRPRKNVEISEKAAPRPRGRPRKVSESD